jgi:hypothetical protein
MLLVKMRENLVKEKREYEWRNKSTTEFYVFN